MSKEEQLKLECSVLMDEFKTVRENILFDVGASRQVINLTLTATGILIAATPFITQSKLIALFLVIPIIFYALAWAQIRYLYLDNRLSSYVITVLAPRVRQVLAEISSNEKRDFESILSWETYLAKVDRRSNLVLLPIAAGNYGINLIVATLSIAAYFVFAYQLNLMTTGTDIILIIINALLLGYTVFLGFWSRFDFVQRKSKSTK